jgi:hypothetical protein
VPAATLSTSSSGVGNQPSRGEGDARRRRPGSRRSTSAWTVYAGADLVAPDLPWACGPQTVAVVLFPGGRCQSGAACSPWAAAPCRRQRERPRALRSPSRPRRLGRSRPLVSAQRRSAGPKSDLAFSRTRTLPAPTASSRGAVTRQGAALVASPQGLTANAAHNPSKSAGVGAAIPDDVTAAVAVSAPSVASAPGIATDVRATAAAPPSPADIRTAAPPHVLHLSLREEPTQPHLLTGKR